MEESMKKPCGPVEEAGRDYDALGLYLFKEDNETLMAAQGLWEFLPAWMEARRMACVDPEYNRKVSGVIAEMAAPVLKAAQEMAGSEPEASGPDELHQS